VGNCGQNVGTAALRLAATPAVAEPLMPRLPIRLCCRQLPGRSLGPGWRPPPGVFRLSRHLRGVIVLAIMLSCIDAACEHQSCGMLSGEFSPQFRCWPTLNRWPGRPFIEIGQFKTPGSRRNSRRTIASNNPVNGWVLKKSP
jgi:hypothetical protein